MCKVHNDKGKYSDIFILDTLLTVAPCPERVSFQLAHFADLAYTERCWNSEMKRQSIPLASNHRCSLLSVDPTHE
jgi:hypothetical protein